MLMSLSGIKPNSILNNTFVIHVLNENEIFRTQCSITVIHPMWYYSFISIINISTNLKLTLMVENFPCVTDTICYLPVFRNGMY